MDKNKSLVVFEYRRSGESFMRMNGFSVLLMW